MNERKKNLALALAGQSDPETQRMCRAAAVMLVRASQDPGSMMSGILERRAVLLMSDADSREIFSRVG